MERNGADQSTFGWPWGEAARKHFANRSKSIFNPEIGDSESL